MVIKSEKKAHVFAKNVEIIKTVLGKEMQNLRSIREMADSKTIEMAIWQTLRISGELYSVYALNRDLLNNTYKVNKISENEENVENRALQLTTEIFKILLNQFADIGQFKALIKPLALRDTQAQMYFLTGLSVTVRKYPDEAFPTPESKSNFLQSLQECLDEIILEESA